MGELMCCSDCYKNIANQNMSVASLWLDLCAYAVKLNGNFLLRESRVPWKISAFRMLEKMGYILTADGHEVQVRVNGHDTIDLNEKSFETFCIDRKVHKCKWA